MFVPRDKDVPYIKRIIGLPGETVRVYDGKVHICTPPTSGSGDLSCTVLEEPYLASGALTTTTRCKKDEFVVTEN